MTVFTDILKVKTITFNADVFLEPFCECATTYIAAERYIYDKFDSDHEWVKADLNKLTDAIKEWQPQQSDLLAAQQAKNSNQETVASRCTMRVDQKGTPILNER